MRILPYIYFRVFSTYEYNKNAIIRISLVRVANKIICQLPRAAILQLSPFISGDNEVHANMTASLRRPISHLLWVSLIGLDPETTPDYVNILYTIICLIKLENLIRGVNTLLSTGSRTLRYIEDLQNLGFNVGILLSHTIGLPVSTKTHRILYNIK